MKRYTPLASALFLQMFRCCATMAWGRRQGYESSHLFIFTAPNPHHCHHCHHFYAVRLYFLTLELCLLFPQANHQLFFLTSRAVNGMDPQTQPGLDRISELATLRKQLLDSDSRQLDQVTGELGDEYQFTTFCQNYGYSSTVLEITIRGEASAESHNLKRLSLTYQRGLRNESV